MKDPPTRAKPIVTSMAANCSQAWWLRLQSCSAAAGKISWRLFSSPELNWSYFLGVAAEARRTERRPPMTAGMPWRLCTPHVSVIFLFTKRGCK